MLKLMICVALTAGSASISWTTLCLFQTAWRGRTGSTFSPAPSSSYEFSLVCVLDVLCSCKCSSNESLLDKFQKFSARFMPLWEPVSLRLVHHSWIHMYSFTALLQGETRQFKSLSVQAKLFYLAHILTEGSCIWFRRTNQLVQINTSKWFLCNCVMK